MDKEIAISHIKEHRDVLDQVRLEFIDSIVDFSKIISNSLKKSGTIYWCGNGGSASDCNHLSAELIGRYKKVREAKKSVSLATNDSVLTCISNDFGYENVFSRQVEALCDQKDVLIAISTSGKSINVINALKQAKKQNVQTLALLGCGGGEMSKIASKSIIVPSSDTAIIQEMHITIGHIICELLDAN